MNKDQRDVYFRQRYEEIKAIIIDEYGGLPCLVLHVVPESEVGLGVADFSRITSILKPIVTVEPRDELRTPIIDTENVLLPTLAGYAKLSENGVIEIVRATYSSAMPALIPVEYEKHFSDAYKSALSTLEELDIELPLYAKFALLGIKDAILYENHQSSPTIGREPNQDDLCDLAEFSIDSYDRKELEFDPFLLTRFDRVAGLFGLKRKEDR